jgi:hypothetical protein
MQLPDALLLLILALVATPPSPVYAQAQAATLQLNQISTFSITSSGKSLSISLPQTTQPIVLSVELCTQIDGQQPPQFFASASTSQSTTSSAAGPGANPPGPPPDNGEEVNIGGGLGFWNSASSLPNGGELQVQLAQTSSGGTWSFNVGVTTNGEDISLGFSRMRIVLKYTCSCKSTTCYFFVEPLLWRFDRFVGNTLLSSDPQYRGSISRTLISNLRTSRA